MIKPVSRGKWNKNGSHGGGVYMLVEWWCYKPAQTGNRSTFSPTRLVSLSKCRCDRTMVNTACDRLLVSFMLVAATVLHRIYHTTATVH